MSVSRLPSGRWRCQIHDPRVGHNVSVSKILGPGYASFATKRDAKAARELARKALGHHAAEITVAQWRERWLSDPLFRRPKQSTMNHNAERTKAFTEKYGALALTAIGDDVVRDWLAAGHATTVPALRAMWSDATSAKAGRVAHTNPWAGLGLHRGTGNRHRQPPTEAMVATLIAHADRLAGPYFAAWLNVAAHTGMRPGELDALRWDRVNFAEDRIRVAEQWNVGSRTFTTPKNGMARDAPLTAPAREALLALPRHPSGFCFVNNRGDHFRPSGRAYYWKAVRAAAGWDGSLYLASRHFAGWFMVNVLGLSSEDVAIALGHTDGGELVRRLYGHRDHALALDRAVAAYAATGSVRPLRVVRKDTA